MKRLLVTCSLIAGLFFSTVNPFPAYAQLSKADPVAVGLASGQVAGSGATFDGKRRVSFNDNWRFVRETNGAISGAQLPGFDDSSWRQLNVPHDWSIELDFNPQSPATHEGGFLDGGSGWYRKTFTLPSSMAGKRVSIDFDGVYMNSTVYLNGQLLGTYPYGYNSFSYDITEYAYTDGRENVLAVKVNNTQPSSRWYSGSGIYRNVYLTVTNPIHVARYGTFVTTPDLETAYAKGRADVHIKTKVNNKSSAAADIKLRSTIYDAEGTAVAMADSKMITASAGTVAVFDDDAVIQNPKLWSTDSPYRYKLVTEVIAGGQTVDTYETLFGARYFEFDANEGFSLNGQYMKLHGASMHHDLGALGAATNYRAVERQMQIMKDMGVNAIRVTHNPASPELLEICNRIGLLVVEEAFDAWKQSKKTYDYARFFSVWADRFASTWAEHDIKEMVDRGKNEPAIIMWSLGNEIYDTANASGSVTARELVKWVKEVDTTRPTTIGQNAIGGDRVNPSRPSSSIKAVLDEVDIVGMNYAENNYTSYHEWYPNWKLYGSETSSATRSRGVYTHPYQNNKMTTYADYQQSSYDNDSVGWGRTAEDAWRRDRDLKHIAGQFIWTGFDYIGEPTPYYNSFPAKSSYFGAVDTAGFPKDIFYYYQSQWKKGEPMVHLLPHWNWKTGDTVRVLAYTNAHKVELVLNGTSLGERSFVNKTTSWGASYKETTEGKTYLEWAVPFAAGELEAIAKDEQGQIVARDKVVTAGPPAGVKLTADRNVITADGKDLTFITADIVDSKGHIVPTADNLIQFSLSGNGELAGVDNGNAASIERYKDSKRKAFSGKALAIVQSSKQAGDITFSASSSGLAGDSIRVFTVPSSAASEKIVAGFERIQVTTDLNEAPNLPSTVQVYYSDASKATKNVTWEAVDPSLYAAISQFTVYGTVEGIHQKVEAYVTVKGAVAVKTIAAATKVGAFPALPSQVSVLYSDDTLKAANVAWNEIPAEQVNQEGSFVVEGTVEGTALKAKATVRVTNESQRKNIMLRESGTSFPQLEATFTAPADNINHINDGIKSYNDSPKNRWTNWTRTPRDQGDSITVSFAKAHAINNLDLFVFTDSGTVVPKTVSVQYWNGSAWENVKNQKNPSPYVVQKNEIRFDTVLTDKLKFHMTPSQAGKFVALTEVEAYSDQIALGATAKLAGITVNGQALNGFDAAKHSYELTLPYGSARPAVEAVGADRATVTVLPVLSLPGKAKIYVTSENGLITSEYTVHVKTEEAKLVSAELIVESTDIVEDDIVELKLTGLLESGETVDLTGANPSYALDNSSSAKIENGKLYALREGQVGLTATVSYKGVTVNTPEVMFDIAKNPDKMTIKSLEPVAVVVDRGKAPVLPPTVVAHYNVGLPRDVSVVWDPIDPTLYEKLGQFTVTGRVEGTPLLAQAKVTVKGAIAVEHVTMATLRNHLPQLPQTVTIYFSDGTEEQKAVAWAAIPTGSLGALGSFELEGTVEGIGLIGKANIRVTDEVGDTQNISKSKNGYDYPKVEASFTNRGPASLDTLEALNDDVISYNDTPHNRWTNWQRTPRAGDWVSVTFGDFGPVEQDVDNMEVYWFGDHGTSYPASFKLQYKSGDTWVDVPNLRSNPSQPAANQANYYTFDTVRTSALRLDMTAQPNMSLAITELKVFAKWPAASSEPKVADIRLDGRSIISEFAQSGGNYEASVKVRSAADIPKITATGEHNTAITLIPSAASLPSTAKIVGKSEDGKKTVVYNVNFVLDADQEPKQAAAMLTGPEQVQSGQQFITPYGMEHVKTPIQAHDVIISYDADKLEFIDAVSKLENVKVVAVHASAPGQVRLIVASAGAGYAINSDGAFIELTWQAKEASERMTAAVATTQVVISDATGAESSASNASFTMSILPAVVPGIAEDVNGDGKISIGDISMTAVHYGKSNASPDWQQVKRADVNRDNKIDIADLVLIARKILE